MEKKKVGRPRFEDLGLERRDNRVSIRLTDEEFEKVKKVSKKLKMSSAKTVELLVHYSDKLEEIMNKVG